MFAIRCAITCVLLALAQAMMCSERLIQAADRFPLGWRVVRHGSYLFSVRSAFNGGAS